MCLDLNFGIAIENNAVFSLVGSVRVIFFDPETSHHAAQAHIYTMFCGRASRAELRYVASSNGSRVYGTLGTASLDHITKQQ